MPQGCGMCEGDRATEPQTQATLHGPARLYPPTWGHNRHPHSQTHTPTHWVFREVTESAREGSSKN